MCVCVCVCVSRGGGKGGTQACSSGAEGALPDCVGSLQSLAELFVFNNNFSGTLPQTLGLARLENLLAHRNHLQGSLAQCRGCRRGRFEKRWVCPLPKPGGFDENQRKFRYSILPTKIFEKQGILLLRPRKSTKMTKMAGVTQAK